MGGCFSSDSAAETPAKTPAASSAPPAAVLVAAPEAPYAPPLAAPATVQFNPAALAALEKHCATGEKASPIVFALLRNAHEVLRGSMLDCQAALQSHDIALFATRWADFKRWQGLHAAMEVRWGQVYTGDSLADRGQTLAYARPTASERSLPACLPAHTTLLAGWRVR